MDGRESRREEPCARAHGGPAWGRELGALEELRDHDEAGVERMKGVLAQGESQDMPGPQVFHIREYVLSLNHMKAPW